MKIFKQFAHHAWAQKTIIVAYCSCFSALATGIGMGMFGQLVFKECFSTEKEDEDYAKDRLSLY